MPPWKPAPGVGTFLGEQRLDDHEIAVLQSWANAGAPPGDLSAAPPVPHFAGGWQLGTPDLVVSLPAYSLAPDGTDVFRIFVVALPVSTTRFVRGLEFRAGGSNIVHHANIRVDPTPASRALDDADADPGYEGLIARSTTYPDGHFLAWTPGQLAPLLPNGLAWTLRPDTDLVVELHLQPTGKREVVQPTIALYFSADPPRRTPAMLRLGRQSLDIAPGNRDYVATDAFVLPVAVDILALQPHAHYLARDLRATATLPDGSVKRLIHIPDWDFRWQQVYRYVDPVHLPAGTRVAMEYRYDNSSENPRNPSQPPRRVLWGQRSGDEMGDLWIQVLTKDDDDLETLATAFRPQQVAEDIVGYQARLSLEPDSAALHDDLALLYLEAGRAVDAVRHFSRSVQLHPASAAAQFNLATALTMAGQRRQAEASYRAALSLRPAYALAHNNLGVLLLQEQRVGEAMRSFADAVQIDPVYAEALDNLGRMHLQRGEWRDGIATLERAVAARPDWPTAHADLAAALTSAPAASADPHRAVVLAERAAALSRGRDPAVLSILAAAYAGVGDFQRAVEAADRALSHAKDGPFLAALRVRRDAYAQKRVAGAGSRGAVRP
jgi:Tfp pilus assembly protein PilF